MTVDDEDSKVVIFDNWKQVSYWLSASRLGHSVLVIWYCSDRLPGWPLALSATFNYFLIFDCLCLHLRNGKSSLSNLCDGQMICVYLSVKSVFVLLLLSVCHCAPLYGGNPVGAAVLTVLELFEVLSFGKVEITLLLTLFVSIQIHS